MRARQASPRVWITGGAIVVAAALAAFVPLPADWIEGVYARRMYPVFQPWVTGVSNLSPVALLDVAVALLLVALGLGFFRGWGTHGVRHAVVRTIAVAAIGTAVIYLLFLGSWGLNYRRVPLERKVDFDRERITPAAAARLAAQAVVQLNAGYAAAHAQPFDAAALERTLGDVEVLLGSRRPAATGRPKRSLAGIYFRYAAIDGMTVPVFLEVILNPDILPVELPSVLAHEWAHLAGYADESEASFVAWVAGIRSGDPVARYSAWLDAYGLSVNALPPALRAALPPLDAGPRQDLREIAARYARSSPRIRTAARGVYDSYLKANRIEEGIDNYEVALQLMLGTILPPAAPGKNF